MTKQQKIKFIAKHIWDIGQDFDGNFSELVYDIENWQEESLDDYIYRNFDSDMIENKKELNDLKEKIEKDSIDFF